MNLQSNKKKAKRELCWTKKQLGVSIYLSLWFSLCRFLFQRHLRRLSLLLLVRVGNLWKKSKLAIKFDERGSSDGIWSTRLRQVAYDCR